jgi:hypothetical protein
MAHSARLAPKIASALKSMDKEDLADFIDKNKSVQRFIVDDAQGVVSVTYPVLLTRLHLMNNLRKYNMNRSWNTPLRSLADTLIKIRSRRNVGESDRSYAKRIVKKQKSIHEGLVSRTAARKAHKKKWKKKSEEEYNAYLAEIKANKAKYEKALEKAAKKAAKKKSKEDKEKEARAKKRMKELEGQRKEMIGLFSKIFVDVTDNSKKKATELEKLKKKMADERKKMELDAEFLREWGISLN